MLDHWEAFGPPVYISAAAYLGLTGKDKGTDQTDDQKFGNLEELETMFQSSGGVIGG